MPTSPERGDSTSTSDDDQPNFGNADVAAAETDPSKIATSQMSLKALVRAHASLAATATVTASGSEATADDWTADADGEGSYVPTVELDSETYLDVRHLSYLRVRADLDTDGNAWVYERVSAGDGDNAATSSQAVTAADGATTVYAASVEGVSYVRVATDQTATVYAGGGS